MLKTLKARGTYLVAKIIQLELSPAIDIYLQLDRHISPARDRHLDCIQKFDFVEHNFVLNFYWLKLSNCRYSLGSYVFFQQEINIQTIFKLSAF